MLARLATNLRHRQLQGDGEGTTLVVDPNCAVSSLLFCVLDTGWYCCNRWCDIHCDSLCDNWIFYMILVDIGILSFIVHFWTGKAYLGHILPSTDECLMCMVLFMNILQIEWVGILLIGISLYELHLASSTWPTSVYSRDYPFSFFFSCGSRVPDTRSICYSSSCNSLRDN